MSNKDNNHNPLLSFVRGVKEHIGLELRAEQNNRYSITLDGKTEVVIFPPEGAELEKQDAVARRNIFAYLHGQEEKATGIPQIITSDHRLMRDIVFRFLKKCSILAFSLKNADFDSAFSRSYIPMHSRDITISNRQEVKQQSGNGEKPKYAPIYNIKIRVTIRYNDPVFLRDGGAEYKEKEKRINASVYFNTGQTPFGYKKQIEFMKGAMHKKVIEYAEQEALRGGGSEAPAVGGKKEAQKDVEAIKKSINPIALQAIEFIRDQYILQFAKCCKEYGTEDGLLDKTLFGFMQEIYGKYVDVLNGNISCDASTMINDILFDLSGVEIINYPYKLQELIATHSSGRSASFDYAKNIINQEECFACLCGEEISDVPEGEEAGVVPNPTLLDICTECGSIGCNQCITESCVVDGCSARWHKNHQLVCEACKKNACNAHRFNCQCGKKACNSCRNKLSESAKTLLAPVHSRFKDVEYLCGSCAENRHGDSTDYIPNEFAQLCAINNKYYVYLNNAVGEMKCCEDCGKYYHNTAKVGSEPAIKAIVVLNNDDVVVAKYVCFNELKKYRILNATVAKALYSSRFSIIYAHNDMVYEYGEGGYIPKRHAKKCSATNKYYLHTTDANNEMLRCGQCKDAYFYKNALVNGSPAISFVQAINDKDNHVSMAVCHVHLKELFVINKSIAKVLYPRCNATLYAHSSMVHPYGKGDYIPKKHAKLCYATNKYYLKSEMLQCDKCGSSHRYYKDAMVGDKPAVSIIHVINHKDEITTVSICNRHLAEYQSINTHVANELYPSNAYLLYAHSSLVHPYGKGDYIPKSKAAQCSASIKYYLKSEMLLCEECGSTHYYYKDAKVGGKPAISTVKIKTETGSKTFTLCHNHRLSCPRCSAVVRKADIISCSFSGCSEQGCYSCNATRPAFALGNRRKYYCRGHLVLAEATNNWESVVVGRDEALICEICGNYYLPNAENLEICTTCNSNRLNQQSGGGGGIFPHEVLSASLIKRYKLLFPRKERKKLQYAYESNGRVVFVLNGDEGEYTRIYDTNNLRLR